MTTLCSRRSSTSPNIRRRSAAASTPSYLELPAEVLTTVMRHHQRYFSVEDATARWRPHFVAVMNTSADPEGLVRHGNERVLRARFNDARFFWDQWTSSKQTGRSRGGSQGTSRSRRSLGIVLRKDRSQRARWPAGAQASSAPMTNSARRAAFLAKADLTTDMVKEFTDLQGIVGGLYAESQGEPEEVWRRRSTITTSR